MKQIIPFKKELLFKTKVSEITSISLEHTLSLKDDDLISGEFYITGDYKMTEGSINREKFQFRLPFDIALDSRYKIDSIVIDIDNFYYEIVNNESLQVNIDVYVDGDKEDITEDIETITEDIEDMDKNTFIDDSKNEVVAKEEGIYLEDRNVYKESKDLFKEEYTPAIEVSKPIPIVMDVEYEQSNKVKNQEFNIFENIDNSDTYVTYYVYIVKEDDNLDSIMNKYNVTKEELGNYNNLENITPGSKLIIPSCSNE